MNRLFEAASGLARLGLMVGVSALAVAPARAGGLLGKHHAAPVAGVAAAPVYVMPATPVYALGTVSGHRQTAVVNTTSTALTTATPPPFVGAVAPVYAYSAAPAVYAPASAYSWNPVPSVYGYSYGLQAAQAAPVVQPAFPQPSVAPRSYLSAADVPGMGPFAPQAPAASPAGRRILQGLGQFARAHAGQIASVLGPLLLQEANRLFLGEFGALPNASDFAILGQIAQAVLGQTQTASGTGTAGGGNMVANLGNGQPIQVQNLTIQANSVQVVSPNVQQTPGPGGTNTGGASATTGSPGPGTVPTPPNPPDSNPTGVSTPPNS